LPDPSVDASVVDEAFGDASRRGYACAGATVNRRPAPGRERESGRTCFVVKLNSVVE